MTRKRFLTLKEACKWASSHQGRKVTKSNISYLIQYGKIRRYDESDHPKTSSNGVTKVSLYELKRYYDISRKQKEWKERLGEDIDWDLSFDNIRESERTKHVHRLHPYKGKFIPQLVEYFLNGHTDDSKEAVFFHKGDIILDPFMGSGTTLVQCLELGLHSIGIDISEFNCMISKVKVQEYDLDRLSKELRKAAKATQEFSEARFWFEPQDEIDQIRSSINEKYYPNPEFKILLGLIRESQRKMVDKINTLSKGKHENKQETVEDLLIRYQGEISTLEKRIMSFLGHNSVLIQFRINSDNIENLVNEFTDKYARVVLQELDKKLKHIPREKQTRQSTLNEDSFAHSPFLSTWLNKRQRMEMQYYLNQIYHQENQVYHQDDLKVQNVMKIILSRTVRSCRATKHVDLATLVKPRYKPYYCRKHFQICRPVPTVLRHLRRYTEDTIKRIREFSQLRKDVLCEVINGDSRTLNLSDYLAKNNEKLFRILEKKKIDGIFTSPPYVGQIDYHEQHAYSYELFNIDRKDNLEIGKKSNGTSVKAQENYVSGISAVLLNVKKYLKRGSNIFIVANDVRNLYPKIAEASGLKMHTKVYKRPVLNRTERDKQPYSESIFRMVFK